MTLGANMFDGFGRRRSVYSIQGTFSKTTWWRYSGWNPIGEYEKNPDPAWTWTVPAHTRSYVPGLAQIDGADASTGAYKYFQTDHLGSVRSIRGQDKALLASYEYSPYGEPYNFSGQPLNIGYTGHMWDPISNMYWTPYRYYMPANARWHMRDPIGYEGDLNLYGYVLNNPILYNDPFGLDLGLVCAVGLGGFAGGIALTHFFYAPNKGGGNGGGGFNLGPRGDLQIMNKREVDKFTRDEGFDSPERLKEHWMGEGTAKLYDLYKDPKGHVFILRKPKHAHSKQKEPQYCGNLKR